MKVKITFRWDQEEYFCTGNVVLDCDGWEDVLREILSIEKRNTVLLVERIFD